MQTARRIALVAVVLGLCGAAYGYGSQVEPETVRRLLAESGALGPVVYLALFALLEPLGVPGVLFVVPATLVWPLPVAVALSFAGAMAAGTVGFASARWLLRDWVEARLPDRFRRYDERLAERGLTTVIVVRLLFFLAPPAHWALGLSRVGVAPFLLGSAIGFAPGILLLALGGKSALDWLGTQPPSVWIGVGALIAAGAAARRLYAARRAGVEPARDAPPRAARSSTAAPPS